MLKNVLKIVKTKDVILIEFIENKNKVNLSFSSKVCSICFCNSGSRVPKIEALFMRMFNYLAYECAVIENKNLENITIN